MKISKNAHAVSFTIALLLIIAAGIGLAGGRNAGAAANPKSTSPELLLPGDAAITTAYGNQEMPQIAAGGSGYLVVWEDSRTNYANIPDNMGVSGGDVGGQQLRDIYAARLDANGNLIDTTPIIVTQASFSQTEPQVSWNGQNWLVVWETKRAVNYSTTIDIVAARVSPDGVVLDNPPIVIDNIPTLDETSPTVASDGNNWVVAWLDSGAFWEIDAVRVSPNGVVLDPGGVPVFTPQFPNAPYNPSIAYAGNEFLLVYSADNKIRGLRINQALQPIGSEFQIGNGNFPEVAGNGTDFYVAWMFNSGVHGSRVTHDGVVLDPGNPDLTGGNGGYPFPDVAWDGTNWLVAWASGQNKAILVRVNASGAILDPNGIVVSNSNYYSAAVAGKVGGGAQLVWTDIGLASVGTYDVKGAEVSAAGAPGTSVSISQGAPRQIMPDLAPNGNGYMLVFQSAIAGETRIKGQRLNADGTAIDSEPFLIMGGSKTLINPKVAWNGSIYLVVWEDTSVSRGFVPGAIFGKRVAADGTVLDAAPFEILGGNTPDVSAIGSGFFVVDTFEQVNHQRTVRGVRVTDAGAVLGTNPVIGSGYAREPNIEPLGDRWLVVWEDFPTHDNPRSDISGVFVGTDGTPGTEFTVADAGLDPTKGPDIAVGNNQALIVYYAGIGADVSQGDLYARRIQFDGTLLDSNPGIRLTNVNLAQFAPSAAWTGSEYLIGFEDYRAVGYLDSPISDVYSMRVSSAGTVIDPNGIPVSNLFIPEVQPIVESNPALGSYLLGFANFKFAAPYASYRIDIRRGQSGQTPVPEATATPTFTPSPTPPSCLAGNYTITASQGAAIVPGTVDSGNHCDECSTEIPLPFAFTLYGETFNSVLATANGTLNFVTADRTGGVNFCLPYSFLDVSILPYWHDMMTDGANGGIFTSVSGTAPTHIFNIEWRACSFGGANCGSETYNFEARLYEGSNKFEVIFGAGDTDGSYATIGAQNNNGTKFAEYSCSTSNAGTGITAGLKLTFELNVCGSPTAVPTFPSSTPVPPLPTNTPGGPLPSSTATASRTPSAQPSGTSQPSTTATAAVPSATNTNVPGVTNTPASTNTSVPGATNTPVATGTTVVEPSATVVACAISFSDVPAGSTFYEFVQCLACRSVLGGYPDGTFRPNDGVTRGQLSKIVSNAAGWNETVSGQTFIDVAPGSTFYEYVERMASRSVIGGYPDGTFRPSDPATRGQISKIVAKAEGYENEMQSQTFQDVAPGATFYLWVENLAVRGIMNGYACGGNGEPCGLDSKSYFRPGNNATRGQIAKIVSNTFFPNCTP